nr:MAG TPA: hypothetical protein [Caudoviricetes sp.]
MESKNGIVVLKRLYKLHKSCMMVGSGGGVEIAGCSYLGVFLA